MTTTGDLPGVRSQTSRAAQAEPADSRWQIQVRHDPDAVASRLAQDVRTGLTAVLRTWTDSDEDFSLTLARTP